MRRAQTNAGSQPIRNLWTNPSFETTTGGTSICRTNSCINPRGINSFAPYGSQTITPNVTGFPAHPEGITTANRVEYASGSGNPGVILLSPATSGSTYTISAWVYHETIPSSGTQGFAQQSIASMSGPPAFVQGTWQRFSWTYTATSTNALGFRISAPGSAGAFLITGVLVEVNSVLGTFFDGATAAAGDFTYTWSGTANASTSSQRGQTVSSLPVGGTAPIQSSEWSLSGTKSLRIIPNVTSTNDTRASLGGDIGAFQIGLQAGKTYTVTGFIRLAAPQTGTLHSSARKILFFYKNVAGTHIGAGSNQAPNAVGITKCSVTVKIPADATEAFVRLMNGAYAQNGEVWWDNVMVVEGEYAGDFINPSQNTFSKWNGAANVSTSVGYPPQLLDIAGKPSVDLTLSNPTTGAGAIPVDPFAARTLYMCYEVYSQTLSYQNMGSYGIAASKGMIFQTATSGNTNMSLRFDFPGGDSNMSGSFTNGRTTRRHVISLGFPQGLTPIATSLNGAADIARVPGSVGTGWDDGRAALTSGVDGKGLRMLVYYAEHDTATRLAISRYLGNQYGANIA